MAVLRIICVAICVAAGCAVLVVAYHFIFAPRNDRAPNYVFCPQKDITSYELALIFRYSNAVSELMKLHPELARHMVPEDEKEKCDDQ